MSSATTSTVLASAVVNAGTFNAPYPPGMPGALFANAVNHKIYALATEYTAPKDFTIVFGASNITVTWLAGVTLPAGENVRIGLDILGADVDDDTPLNRQIVRAPLVGHYFGAPLAAAANSIALSQAVAAGAQFNLNGARGAVMDVPRNVVASWTGTSVLTFRGFDVDGQPMTEVAPSGVSFIGKKAFASISRINSASAITAATVGCGLLLGFPARIAHASQLLYEIKNGVVAAPTGATVLGTTVAASGSSGDVRGTYSPLAPPDGLTAYTLVALSNAPDDRGVQQFAG